MEGYGGHGLIGGWFLEWFDEFRDDPFMVASQLYSLVAGFTILFSPPHLATWVLWGNGIWLATFLWILFRRSWVECDERIFRQIALNAACDVRYGRKRNGRRPYRYSFARKHYTREQFMAKMEKRFKNEKQEVRKKLAETAWEIYQ